MPVMLFLDNFPCSTTKALDRRIILHASTISLDSVLFVMYAKYGCIQVSSIIMTSFGSAVLFIPVLPAPKPSSGLEGLLPFIDLSMISSQNTPGGMGKHRDPMFARLSASSLLALLICETSDPSKVPSR
jgi:hypothetical protein